MSDIGFFSTKDEWLRDLAAAEAELRKAKTEKQIRAIQIRIKWIKHFISHNTLNSNTISTQY